MQLSDVSPPSIGVISWVLLILAAFFVWRKIIGMSVTDFVSAIVSEFGQLLSFKPTPGALNALGLISLTVLTILVGFSSSFWEMLSDVTSDDARNSGEKTWVVVVLIGIIALKSLVCVALCRKSKN